MNNEAAADENEWDEWPDVQNATADQNLNLAADNAAQLNLNVAPGNLEGFDLNADAELEEMVIDPVQHGPMPQEMFLELNDLLNQVNEQEEDQNIDNADQILEDLANAVNLEPQPVQVDLPHLDGSAENFLHHEIQENDLMNDEELQQDHENMNQNVPNGHHNLQIGFVLTSFHNRPVPDSYLNWEGPWAKFFKPAPGSVPHSLIPKDWASFFSAVLLSPDHFEKAKNLLKVKNLLKAISDDQCVGFTIPEKCPTSASLPNCTLTELDQELPALVQEVTDIDPSEAPPVEKEPKKVRGKTIIVDSELRRSPKIQESKKGFHNPVCKAKQCLGCSSAPLLYPLR